MSSYDSETGFSALLNMLIPPEPMRGLPGGAEVGCPPDSVADECLKILNEASLKAYGKGFSALDQVAQSSVLSHLTKVQKNWLTRLSKRLAEYYYLNPVVAAAVGEGLRAPFPDGYHIEEGDLTLLEPVYLRGKIYRDV